MRPAAPVDILRRTFAAHAGRTAVADLISGRRFSFAELEDTASRLAQRLGVGAPERVLLLLGNGAELVLSYLACFQCGATSVPINPSFLPDEIAKLVEAAAPSVVVTDAAGAARLPPSLRARVLRFGVELDVAQLGAAPRFAAAAFPTALAGLAHIVFSSGTTGLPKAIPITFDTIIGHAAMFGRSHGFDASHTFYCILPLAYLGGWYNLTLVPLLAGATVVVDRELGGAGIYRFWSNVLEHGVDCFWVTPSILAALLGAGTESAEQAAAIAARMRWGMVGMAPLMPSLKSKFEQAFGFRLQQSYGLSETLLFTSWMSDTSLPDTSVGRVLDGYEVCVVGADGARTTAPDLEGEIAVRGAWLMSGYWNQPELTAKVFDDAGWFRTGDLGRFDARGCLYITGRMKDLIIRGGVNISPAEIENTIMHADGVREAAVIGVDDELYGEKIVAFVSATTTPSEIIRHCRKHLSAAKVPAAVHIVDALPLNASGKVHKAALRRRLLDGTKL